MANLAVKDGSGATKYLSANGAGTNGDPHLPVQANSTEIRAAVEAAATSLAALDNAIAGNEVQVDVLTLPAIGLTASEAHIGEVSGNSVVLDVTLSLDTSAYAAGDVLADTQVVTGAMRTNDGTGVLHSIVLNDKDDQGSALDLVFLRANVSLGTENAAPSISDTDADNILGIVSVTALDWIDLGGCRMATKTNIGLLLRSGAAATTLWVAAIARGTPTHTASGITMKLGILRD
jgi:hypothetical protein